MMLMAGTWSGVLPGRIPPPYSATYLAFWTIYAVGAWAWMVAVLGVARRWLNADTATFRYGRTMGYAWYIIHQPVIIAVAYVVVQMRVGVALKFLLILLASLGGTFAIGELLRVIPVLGRVIMPPSRRGVGDHSILHVSRAR